MPRTNWTRSTSRRLEEIKLGTAISEKVRARFGVVQDPAVHKYVTLVGRTIADQTERPGLPWTFIVLDTDGVNAFASPGGFVHITRGALDRNDELDADKFSVSIAPKLAYAPATLADFLTRLDERNKDVPTRNGLFASHPETKERIDTIRKQAGSATGATGKARYAQNIK